MKFKGLLRSLIFAAVCLAAITIVNFFLPRLMPGDPVLNLIGVEDHVFTQEEYDRYYRAMGLDKSTAEQFGNYLKGLFKGELGYSYHLGRDVGEVLSEKIPRTLQVALPAWIISAALAYLLGTAAGYRRRHAADTAITGFMVVFDTAPTFLISMLLLIIFAYELNVLPFGSLNSIIIPSDPALAFADRLKHLVLPIAALVTASTPSKYLMMRNTAARAMDEKYVIFAKARGLNTGTVINRHIFTNIGQPFITMLGTSFGKTLSGSIIVEMIFSIDGMGLLVNNAIADKDYTVLQAALFFIAVSVIIANFAADIICAVIDPRSRKGVSA